MPRKTQKRTPKRKVARRSKKGSKRTKRRSSKKIKRVLSSTYGIGNLMKIDQKDKITSSGPYHLEKFFKENQKGYKQQRVAKKDKYKKPKHPPIPSNIKGKKKKKSSSKAAKDSFLAGIDSKPSKKGSWVEHVKAYWEERRKSEPGYKYKDAMKDAKKTW